MKNHHSLLLALSSLALLAPDTGNTGPASTTTPTEAEQHKINADAEKEAEKTAKEAKAAEAKAKKEQDAANKEREATEKAAAKAEEKAKKEREHAEHAKNQAAVADANETRAKAGVTSPVPTAEEVGSAMIWLLSLHPKLADPLVQHAQELLHSGRGMTLEDKPKLEEAVRVVAGYARGEFPVELV